MPIVSAFPQGTPIRVALRTADPVAAAVFYRGLFGWEIPPVPAGTAEPAVASLRGVAVAELGGAESAQRPAWIVFFSADDAGEAAAAAARAGGTILHDAGRLAVLADPAGAVFGVRERHGHSPLLRDEPGALEWVELASADPEASLAFYEDVLDVGVSEMRVAGEPYGLLDVGETSVAGVFRPGGRAEAHWIAYFSVADLDAAVVRATELGGTLEGEPASSAGVGRWAEVADPQGGRFGLLQPEA